MSNSRDEAKSWLRDVAWKHTPSNARRYQFQIYTGEASINVLGLQADLNPQEGKLVEVSEKWAAIKTARTEFFVCATPLMEFVPEIGATIRVTPYVRRKFDGTRLDAPKVQDLGGYMTSTIIIGERVSPIPVDKASLKSPYLRDMIAQLEELPAPDGTRTIAQLLVDAGAGTEPICFDDPEDDDVIRKPPTIEFRITSQKWNGYLRVIYDRAMDFYRVQLTDTTKAKVEVDIQDVDFTSLGEVIANLVDDGNWRIAKVEVLKPGPRKVAKAASEQENLALDLLNI